MRSVLLFVLILSLVGASSEVSNAEIIQVILTGQVTEISATDAFGAEDSAAFVSTLPFDVGATIKTYLTIDTSTPSSFDDGLTARYFKFGNYQTIIGGYTVTNTPIALIDVSKWSDIRVEAAVPLDNSSGWRLDSQFGYGSASGLTLSGNAAVIPNTSLPTHFQQGDFSSMQFLLQIGPTWNDEGTFINDFVSPTGTHTGQMHRISGVYSSISTVPEPSCCVALLATALTMTGRLARKKLACFVGHTNTCD